MRSLWISLQTMASADTHLEHQAPVLAEELRNVTFVYVIRNATDRAFSHTAFVPVRQVKRCEQTRSHDPQRLCNATDGGRNLSQLVALDPPRSHGSIPCSMKSWGWYTKHLAFAQSVREMAAPEVRLRDARQCDADEPRTNSNGKRCIEKRTNMNFFQESVPLAQLRSSSKNSSPRFIFFDDTLFTSKPFPV